MLSDIDSVQRKYNLHKRDVPKYLAVNRWTKAFQTCGSIQGHISINKHSPSGAKLGRRKNACTPEKVAAVNAAVLRSPKLSIRKSITHRPFWATLGQRRGFQRDLQWLQLDGAFPHTALENRLWLEDKFDDQIVSLKTPNECAPHSPDLTPMDYFFGGYCKDNVYENKPATIADLKTNITRHIRAIQKEMCRRVVENFKRRLEVCIQQNGAHIEHLPK